MDSPLVEKRAILDDECIPPVAGNAVVLCCIADGSRSQNNMFRRRKASLRSCLWAIIVGTISEGGRVGAKN